MFYKLFPAFISCFLLMLNLNLCSDKSEPGWSPDRVVIISRHGDRAPIYRFSWEFSGSKQYWPMGLGHLTQVYLFISKIILIILL